MTRSHFALLAILGVALASAPADAARPRRELVDQDLLTLPAGEVAADLRLFRTPNGIDLRDILISSLTGQVLSEARLTPLDFQYPTGSTWGSYAADDDATVYASFANAAGIRVFELGDLSQPGPLAPVQLGAIAVGAGFDPASTQTQIIAVLIGLLVEHVPAVSFVADGTSNTMTLGFDGERFRPVGLLDEESLWFFY